jgi:hypothetical protein
MRAETFLQSWSSISGREVTDAQRVWVERFCREGSALLEFKPEGLDPHLLLVAKDRAKARLLEFVLRKAFASDRLQPLWGEGQACVTAAQHSVLEGLGVGSWSLYRFGVQDRKHVGTVYKQLTEVEVHRLPSVVPLQSSTGALIRALRRAVDQGDQEKCTELLGELRGRSLTDRYQHDFLALWAQAKLDPIAVAEGSLLRDVLALDQPEVPAALLEVVGDAVIRTCLYPGLGESSQDPLVEALKAGKAKVPVKLVDRALTLKSEVGAVMRTLASIRDGEHLLLPGDLAILEECPASVLADKVPGPTVDRQTKYQVFETANEEIATSGLSTETARALDELYLAGEIQARAYLDEWWDRLDPESRARQTQGIVLFEKRAGEEAAPKESDQQDVRDWLTWLTRLKEGSAEPDRAGSGFSYDELPLVDRPDAGPGLGALCALLEELAGDEALVQKVVEVLPSILDAWAVSELDRPVSREFSTALGAVIQFGLLLSEDTLSTYYRDELLYRFFEVGDASGISPEAYGEVTKELAARVEELRAPKMLEKLLDVFEFLTDHPRADGTAFDRLAEGFCTKAHQHHQRLEPDALTLLSELAAVAGLSAEAASLQGLIPADEPQADDAGAELPSMAGKKILIYTLVEPAGKRAQFKIEAQLGAVVRLNSDHQASAALDSALDWADIVVCVTRAAQHAATNEIDRRVPEEFLIRPPGKGSSSIWSALKDWRIRRSG